MRSILAVVALLVVVFYQDVSGQTPPPVSLKGSPASVAWMAHQADVHDFSRLSTGRRILAFLGFKLLEEIKGNQDYRLHEVSYPYVRKEVKLFVERLSRQSRVACSDGLVVTGASRPTNRRPKNGSKKSVHPAGMALDLRIPDSWRCRAWLEGVLLSLERRRVLEATREKSPAHYHIAVFPKPYKEYVEGRTEQKKPAQKPAPRKKK